MKVLFIVPYPQGTAPSQRFRFEHYLDQLAIRNIQYRIESFLDMKTWNILYKQGYKWKKIGGVLNGYIRRFRMLFLMSRYNFVFIHREAAPLGPAWFEWMITRVLHKKVIYDFDDAIWIPWVSKNNNQVKSFRNFGKVKKICCWATKVVTGNSFLSDYALQYNKNVMVIPTVVDTEKVYNRLQDQATTLPTIGWTGSFSTLKYIDIVLPVLRELQKQYDFAFVVIADKDPRLDLKNYRFIPWSRETEITDLLNLHIGLMPLYEDDISKGKCGFKAIQYMSLGIPAVVSPVGVNTEIVEDGRDGFLCATENEWKKRLEELLTNPVLRSDLGRAARKKIERSYSVQATSKMFLDLFE